LFAEIVSKSNASQWESNNLRRGFNEIGSQVGKHLQGKNGDDVAKNSVRRKINYFVRKASADQAGGRYQWLQIR